MLTLHQRAGAGRPLRVRWALEEAGAPYDFAVMSREDARDRHGHPFGRVPVLESDDGSLFESAALCLQIADLYTEAELIPPAASFERGLVYQWVLFAMTEVEPALLRAYIAREGGDGSKSAKAAQRLDDAVAALPVSPGPYLLGARFTVADVVAGGVLHNAREYELLPDRPAALEYLQRLDARPAKQRAYAE